MGENNWRALEKCSRLLVKNFRGKITALEPRFDVSKASIREVGK